MSENLKNEIRRIIELHEKMKNAYFFSPPGSTKQRREYEERRSNFLELEHNSDKIIIEQKTSCSCRNVYYKLSITVNDKKKDVRVLKKLEA